MSVESSGDLINAQIESQKAHKNATENVSNLA